MIQSNPRSLEQEILERVEHLLDAALVARDDREAVGREWAAHLAETCEELERQGTPAAAALDLASRQFGDGTTLRAPMNRLHWRLDIAWAARPPSAVWGWMLVEMVGMQLLWPGTRPGPLIWGAVLVGVALALFGLVVVTRLSVCRLRRGPSTFQRFWSCFGPTALGAWAVIKALQMLVVALGLQGARELSGVFGGTEMALAAVVALAPLTWQWMGHRERRTTAAT